MIRYVLFIGAFAFVGLYQYFKWTSNKTSGTSAKKGSVAAGNAKNSKQGSDFGQMD